MGREAPLRFFCRIIDRKHLTRGNGKVFDCAGRFGLSSYGGPSFLPADIAAKSSVARLRIIAGDKRYLVTVVGDLVDGRAES